MARPSRERGLLEAVKCAFDSVTAENCRGWFRHLRAYHSKCLRKERILKEADDTCPTFRVLEDDEYDSEDEILIGTNQ